MYGVLMPICAGQLLCLHLLPRVVCGLLLQVRSLPQQSLRILSALQRAAIHPQQDKNQREEAETGSCVYSGDVLLHCS